MNRREFLIRSGAAASISILGPSALLAQAPAATPAAAPVQPPPPVTEFKSLRRNVGIFTGGGGTIGWLVNPDAVAAVDTQFPNTAAIFLRDLAGRNDRKFDVSDGAREVTVSYRGQCPDLFREGKGVVAQGRLAGLQVVADEGLAKHDENSMPPEAAAALQQAEVK